MSNNFLQSKRGKTIMNMIYGIGAAVVIAGALFKIMHWKFANEMLIVGMGTEVLIFIISAFEPPHQEYDWSLVYPELAGMDTGKSNVKKIDNGTVTQQLDKMLEEAKVGPELISSLGTGLQSLSSNVGEMSKLSNASVAADSFATNATEAAKVMADISLGTAGAKESLNTFSNSLTGIVENLNETASATGDLKGSVSEFNNNLAKLNNVYGGMLSAMGVSKAQ